MPTCGYQTKSGKPCQHQVDQGHCWQHRGWWRNIDRPVTRIASVLGILAFVLIFVEVPRYKLFQHNQSGPSGQVAQKVLSAPTDLKIITSPKRTKRTAPILTAADESKSAAPIESCAATTPSTPETFSAFAASQKLLPASFAVGGQTIDAVQPTLGWQPPSTISVLDIQKDLDAMKAAQSQLHLSGIGEQSSAFKLPDSVELPSFATGIAPASSATLLEPSVAQKLGVLQYKINSDTGLPDLSKPLTAVEQ
jgi:hypothetical protein